MRALINRLCFAIPLLLPVTVFAQLDSIEQANQVRFDTIPDASRSIDGVFQVQITGSYDHLANQSDEPGKKEWEPWHSVAADFSYRARPGQTYYGRLRYLNQFGIADGDVFGGGYFKLTERLTLVTEAMLGFKHRITPEWAGFGQLEYSVGSGWRLWAGLRHSEYTNTIVNLFSGTVEKYFGDFRGMYTLYESYGTNGWKPRPSHHARLDYYYSDASRIGVGASVGYEITRIREEAARFYNTGSVYLLGRHWVDPDWALGYELSYRHQLSLYNAYGIDLGIRHRF